MMLKQSIQLENITLFTRDLKIFKFLGLNYMKKGNSINYIEGFICSNFFKKFITNKISMIAINVRRCESPLMIVLVMKIFWRLEKLAIILPRFKFNFFFLIF